MKYKTILACLVIWSISGCTKQSVQPTEQAQVNRVHKSLWAVSQFNEMQFSNAIELTEAQKFDFLAYFNSNTQKQYKEHKRIYNYLERYMGGFYYTNKTLNATEALAKQTGNCMSLALLTTALAKLVDIKIEYQLINSSPLYYRSNKNIMISSHIRTKLFAPEEEKLENYYYLGKTHLIIDYYKNQLDLPGRSVSSAEFKSMYFTNLAAENYDDKKYTAAYSFSANALEAFPDSANNLNTHALILNRVKGTKPALALYEEAIRNELTSIDLLINYKTLLVRSRYLDKAKDIDKLISIANDDNPYRWLEEGNREYEKGAYAKAMQFYDKALKLAPYLDEVYLSKAKTFYKQGDFVNAKNFIVKAKDAPLKVNELKLYEAKLAAFESH